MKPVKVLPKVGVLRVVLAQSLHRVGRLPEMDQSFVDTSRGTIVECEANLERRHHVARAHHLRLVVELRQQRF
jgi:hypothetical protein